MVKLPSGIRAVTIDGNAQSSIILMTDIYRSSSLWERYPDEFSRALESHNQIVEEAVDSNSGEIMKNLGDGYIALFNSAHDCVGAMIALKKEIKELPPLPDDSQMRLRLVGHGGQLRRLAVGEGLFGHALNRASRIVQVCHPGQVLLSQAIQNNLAEKPEDTDLTDLGMHRLRDLEEPEHLYQLKHPSFAVHEFPPLPTLGYRPNNLVYQPNSFIGREQEMEDLRNMFARGDHRLITITAPGGYGKSRLATQLCANLLDEFEHGVFEVLLAPVEEASRLASSAAAALGVQLYGRSDPQTQLIDFLRKKNMLVSFDNFEHMMQSKELIAEILKVAPKVNVLVTSREPLRLSGEVVYALDPLPTTIAGREIMPGKDGAISEHDIQDGKAAVKTASEHMFSAKVTALSESVQLFLDRAILVKRDFDLNENNLTLVDKLCSRLNGVPLAIELAAGWVDSLTLPELLDEVGKQVSLTARMADVPERQRSIRASLDWSYSMLAEDQAEVLLAVSAFKGGFFLDALASVASVKGDLRLLLSQLCDKGWLFTREVLGKTRYFVRDAAMKVYAVEKFCESDQSKRIARGHARFFSELAGREGAKLEGEGQVEAYNLLEVDVENVYRALSAAIRRREPSLLLPFTKYMFKFLELGSRYQDGLTWYVRLTEVADLLPDVALKEYSLIGLSSFLHRLGQYDESAKAAEEALRYARVAGDKEQQADCLYSLGLIAQSQGRYAEAANLCQEGLAIYREIGNQPGVAECLSNMGLVAKHQGRYQEAQKLHEEALEIQRNRGNRLGFATALNDLGVLAREQGSFQQAEKLHREAMQLFGDIGNRHGIAASLNNLGIIAFDQSRFAEADRLYGESLQITQELGDRHGIASALNNLGNSAYCQWNYWDAEKFYRDSLEIKIEIGDRRGVAACLGNLGFTSYCQGHYDVSERLHKESLQIKREINSVWGIAHSLGSLGAVYIKQKKMREARRCLLEALKTAKEIKNHPLITEILVVSGHMLSLTDFQGAAAIILAGAENHVKTMNYPLDPIEHGLLEDGNSNLRKALSEDERAAHKAKGLSTSLDELIDLAMKSLGGLGKG